MKYWIPGLSLMVMACSHSVDVKDQASYKCGDQIIRVTVLNDNSMIVRANGIDHVLTPPRRRVKNTKTYQVSFTNRTANLSRHAGPQLPALSENQVAAGQSGKQKNSRRSRGSFKNRFVDRARIEHPVAVTVKQSFQPLFSLP